MTLPSGADVSRTPAPEGSVMGMTLRVSNPQHDRDVARVRKGAADHKPSAARGIRPSHARLLRAASRLSPLDAAPLRAVEAPPATGAGVNGPGRR